jgi:hypothetical protein
LLVIRDAVILLLLAVPGHGSSPSNGPDAQAAEPKAKARAEKPARAGEKDKSAAAPTDAPKLAAEAPRRGPVDVRVLTREEMVKRRSSFILPQGAMPGERASLGDTADSSDLPRWRQATYFGIRARGQFFVYVVDCSGSMLDDDRLARATSELRRSVLALTPPQKFEVIFFNQDSIPMPGGPMPRTADLQTKNLLVAWLRLIEPDGGTDPRLAMRQALGLRPDAVFLLSDGAFPEGTVASLAKLNSQKIPIHCVDLSGGLAGDDLKRIAQASGGRYASRPGSLHVRP